MPPSAVVTAVDACYALLGTERQWIEGLTRAFSPMLDAGFGVAGWAFGVGEWTWDGQLPVGVDSNFGKAMWEAAALMSDEQLLRCFTTGRVTSGAERLGLTKGMDEEAFGGPLALLGLKDLRALTVSDATGRGVALASGLSQPYRTSRREADKLERVSAHLLAGFRLRQSIARIDAVHEPGGRSVHAEGEARQPDHQESLVRAVKAYEQAHGARSVSNAESALEAWEALVAGRWSIVEQFESDGRRYLFARRNPPEAPRGSPLSPVEAHVLLLRAQGLTYKLIGYELGITATTANRVARLGMRKIGVRQDIELPALFRGQLAAALAPLRARSADR
jgi:DNA-binding CsgD family transcriptional regulator